LTDKRLYQIALTQINGVGVTLARNLMQYMGDEEAIFRGDVAKLSRIPRISRRLIAEIRSSEVIYRAERELNFAINNNIDIIFFTEDDYPARLSNCIDAPILLYSKGKNDFNRSKTISIVGTRNATRYGLEYCEEFVKKISEKIPDIQIVSGLAYGIDVCAHRACLKYDVSTVGVLAHGLDRIYPFSHRETALKMQGNGAIISEFPSHTTPDRFNFVKRNRIVAGMSDAVLVFETRTKGGSLITADIANSYFREVFALPGRYGDEMSKGCNKLIAENKANILEGVDEFILHMGWQEGNDNRYSKNTPKQTELFIDLNEEERRIYNLLVDNNSMQINTMSIELNTPVSELFMTLLELEMKNLIKSLPGGMYQII
jgi:DNA processing protein